MADGRYVTLGYLPNFQSLTFRCYSGGCLSRAKALEICIRKHLLEDTRLYESASLYCDRIGKTNVYRRILRGTPHASEFLNCFRNARSWKLTLRSLLILLVSGFCSSVFAEDKPLGPNEKPAWLEGSGSTLKIKISGEVLDENGVPVKNPKVSATASIDHSDKSMSVIAEGSRFHAWVPVGSGKLGSVRFAATEPESQKRAFSRISNYELRLTAVEGMKLIVKVPSEIWKFWSRIKAIRSSTAMCRLRQAIPNR